MQKLIGQVRTSGKGIGYFRNTQTATFIEISTENLNTALDLDKVEIEITGKNQYGENTGKVTKITERDKNVWVGTVKKEMNEKTQKEERVFVPDNKRFYPQTEILNHSRFAKLKSNEKVVVELVAWENPLSSAQIRIKKVIGKIGENETEMQAAIYDKGLVLGFPKEVEEAANKLKEKSAELIASDLPNRKDLRSLNVFTIDPADAKDFDDALSVETLENGNYSIGVHIADPSFFVTPGGIIDKEAIKRATSVYLVDRTVPMLPEVLSNDLCSLNPNEEKMAFSLIFEIDKKAKITNEWFGKSIIISKKRFDYLQAQEILNKKNGEYFTELKILSDLTDIMEKERVANGSLEFGGSEVKFKMDNEKFPYEIYLKPRVRTMEIIEEFMLLANKQISRYVSLDSAGNKTENPFIYRTHDKPKQEKITELINFLDKIGTPADTNKDGNLDAPEINRILKAIKGKPEEDMVALSVLRSMQKAVYDSEPKGHFGLAFPYYSHFTSPIRRYPDIIAHRLALQYLNGQSVANKEKIKIQKDAEHSSEMEKKAVAAERDSISFKYAQYYSKKIGEEFNGIITGITKFGLFVEEKTTKAQALLNVRNMGRDFFEFNEEANVLRGKSTKKVYKLGDKIYTYIMDVNVNDRNIDLSLDKNAKPTAFKSSSKKHSKNKKGPFGKNWKKDHKKHNKKDRHKKRH